MDSKILEIKNTSDSNRRWIVYKHVSPIGKVYVGITSNKPEKRWNNGRNYKDNTYFKHAINKYGWDNFEHVIIDSGLSEKEAKTMEISLIREYKEQGISYNISAGGDGNSKKVSEETRKKLSISMKGHKSYIRNENWRKEKSEFMKNNPTLTDEARLKAYSKSSEVLSKAVVQYNLDDTIVNIYNSIKEATKITGIDTSLIAKVCKGGYFNKKRGKFVTMTQAKGYKWKYKDK